MKGDNKIALNNEADDESTENFILQLSLYILVPLQNSQLSYQSATLLIKGQDLRVVG